MCENSNNYKNNGNHGSDFGTHTVIHHQHYQMVDLLMQHCRRSMCRLNPHALTHMPKHQEDVNETADSKKINKRQKSLSDQGWKKTKECKKI